MNNNASPIGKLSGPICLEIVGFIWGKGRMFHPNITFLWAFIWNLQSQVLQTDIWPIQDTQPDGRMAHPLWAASYNNKTRYVVTDYWSTILWQGLPCPKTYPLRKLCQHMSTLFWDNPTKSKIKIQSGVFQMHDPAYNRTYSKCVHIFVPLSTDPENFIQVTPHKF